MQTFRLALVLSFFCFAFCKGDDKKPYYIKKSSFCSSVKNREVCSSNKYDFLAVVQQVVDDINKLSKKEKGIAQISGVCANALKNAMCSDYKPLCFEGNDDSGAKRVCAQLRYECPLLEDDSFEKYEERCVKYLQRKFLNLTCVGIGADVKFKGYCPKPTGKMPAVYWEAYVEKSDKLESPMKYLEVANSFTGKELLSADCMEKIKNTVCVPLYCSEDEKSIIVPNLQDKCNDVLECINKVSDNYSKLSSILEPIKESLNGGCDKIVEAVKGEVAQTKNDAYMTNMSHAPELLLFTIALLATFTNNFQC